MTRVAIRAVCKCGKDVTATADTENECWRELKELGWSWKILDRYHEKFLCPEDARNEKENE